MAHLFLIGGLSGTGKTSFALTAAQPKDVIVSADDYMIDGNGNYSFDSKRLQAAHDMCRNQVAEWMQEDRFRIWVHNTFLEDWELEPYRLLADRYGYMLHVAMIYRPGAEIPAHISPSVMDLQKAKLDSLMDEYTDGQMKGWESLIDYQNSERELT